MVLKRYRYDIVCVTCRQPEAMARFLDPVSVEVTAMFRDPYFHKAFREMVVPDLRSPPLVRVWHAGRLVQSIASVQASLPRAHKEAA